MSFTLDTQAAKAGSGGSGRIDTTGKYKGKIKFAKTWKTDNGANMVVIKFESDEGQSADLRICTHSGDAKGNEPTYGYKQIQAIMACLKVRSLTEVEQVIEDYDHESKEVKPMKRMVFKEMTGAKIGLALYRHDQTNSQNGNDFFAMDIAAPFNYESEQTAKEVLDQKPAEQLSKIVLSMKDKDSRQQAGSFSSGYDMQAPAGSDLHEDIPF